MVEQWNNDGETVEKRWLNNGTMRVEQWNRYSGIVEQWNSGKEMVEQWNSYGGRVEQIWGTVEQ